jgi:hypothetical protein
MLKNTYSILVENPEEIRSLGGRSRHMGEDNIKTYFNEIRQDDMYWIQLAEDMIQRWAFVDTVMILRVP